MEDVREEREEERDDSGVLPETPAEQATSVDRAEEASASPEPPAEVPAAEAPEPEAPAKEQRPEDRFRWYVVHTYSGHEERAAKNIERAVRQADLMEQVPRVLVPTESVAEMKNGKKTITDRKFFPSYVLVKMEMSDEAWRVISNTPGVTRFVGVGAKPQPISEDEIVRILGRIEGTKEKPTPTIPYHIGEHVKVTDGPFTDFTGVVDEVHPERGKLKVMVTIFGRATPVELDFLQVKSL
jgi:transcriptional antiterminator NusG